MCLAPQSRRSPDRQPVDAQGRLAYPDGYALAFLVAGADTGVEAHVVADHGNVRQRIRSIADERRTPDRIGDLAVLDHIGLVSGEHELAADDIDLAAAEICRIQAVADRSDDLGGIPVAVEHVGVGHPRHRHMRVRLAPCVAGGRHAHQPRVQRVLDVTSENAILDQHAALRRIALVVHVQRTAAIGNCAVVDHRHAWRCDTLADAAGKSGAALAIEIAFEPVANGFMQQNTRPARPQHHRHRAGRRRPRRQIGHGLVHRLGRVVAQDVVGKIGVVETSAAAGAALFAAAIVLGDDLQRQPDQRTHVRGQHAVGTRDQHDFVFARQ